MRDTQIKFFPLLLIFFLLIITIHLKATSSEPKIPYLRNEMTSPKLQKFKEVVQAQAKSYPDLFYLESLNYQKEIALTFDDGPEGIYTAQVLDILKNYNIKATFFLVGSNLEKYSSIVKRIQAEEHAIGSHSYSHADLRKLSKFDAYEHELNKTGLIFQKLLGFKPAFFRPPYGAVTDDQILYFGEKGLRTINWSIDTFDWDSSQNSVEEITEKVFKYAHEGAIILMHTGGKDKTNTINSLPLIIETLTSKGYTFKTIPDLLNIPATIKTP